MPEITLHWLFVIFVVFLLVLLTFFSYLVVLKLFINFYDARVEALKTTFQKQVSESLQTGKAFELTEKKRMALEALSELLVQYNRILSDEASQRRLKAFAEDQLEGHFQKRLKYGRWSTRLNTIYRIEDLNMTNLMNDVISLYRKKRLSLQEKSVILRFWCRHEPESFIEVLLSEELPAFMVKELLGHLDEVSFSKLVERYNECSLTIQKSLVAVIGQKRNLQYLPLVERLLDHRDDELRLQALKAISEIGYISDKDVLARFIHSDRWQERMAASRAMGTVKTDRFLPLLEERLMDSSWFVRSTSAWSMLSYKNGKERLRHIAEFAGDPYARDIAMEVLEKEG